MTHRILLFMICWLLRSTGFVVKRQQQRTLLSIFCRAQRQRTNRLSSPPNKVHEVRRKTTPSSKLPNTYDINDDDVSGVRINKCLPTLSRRGADTAIDEGRVTVNGQPAKCGDRVHGGSVVRLDGKIQQWEKLADAKRKEPAIAHEDRSFVYVKYWKVFEQ